MPRSDQSQSMSPERRTAAPHPGQEHYTAPLSETPLKDVDAFDDTSTPRSMWRQAAHSLLRDPVFIVSAILIAFILFVVAFPGVFTSQDPTAGSLANANQDPSGEHPFGTSRQGYDIFSRVIHGTRTSVIVGFFTMIGSTLIGAAIGALAGYVGGWVDEIVSRVVDVFFAIPLILGAIVIGARFQGIDSIWVVILVLSVFGWTNIARITRGAVIGVKSQEFVMASTALGAGRFSNLMRHVLPNALAPIIVTATVNLGVFIVAEATLSFLGVGLPPTVVSWGGDISTARTSLTTHPMQLMYPSIGLAVTVLSFIMLGDAVRDALDPKAKKR
ncbi:ABC transporter permease [Helcobacillus massiliensis]|uniref:Oligopeptide transport system permease protein n=2 Tax=Helcobacillus TaxID=1161125 RepID=A0A839QXV1_9MICO|nr:oligopeptide transport system permease protein [Helcobacillus massiliensis]